MYGPPGTGKTYIAQAIATECDRHFLNVTSANIFSCEYGSTAKNLNLIFQCAKNIGPSLIFFDEIDSFGSKRISGEHEETRRTKNQFLMALDAIINDENNLDTFVLATSNFPWELDPAILRRFNKRIYIPGNRM